ncbi:hypothetical protein D3C87_2032560 [compost metagenome]
MEMPVAAPSTTLSVMIEPEKPNSEKIATSPQVRQMLPVTWQFLVVFRRTAVKAQSEMWLSATTTSSAR